jgi:tetratricopeptide (TPR) repeat protein
MFNLQNLRLPYREDSTFSCLSFLVFICPLAFILLTNENFETIKFSLMLVLVGCALLSFLYHQLKNSGDWKFNKAFFYLMAAFFIWALLSTIFSIDVLYSVFGTYYRFTDSLVFYSALIIFLILLVNTLDKDKFIFLLKILVFDALVVSVIACLQAFNITYFAGTGTGFVQGPSLLGNPDFSAMFLAAIMPFVLYFWLQAKKFSSKIYYGLCGFIIFTANLFLASRGALLAMFSFACLALVLLLLFHFPKKFFLSLFFLVLISLVYSSVFLDVSRPLAVASIVQSADSNTTSRLAAWQISLHGVALHPVLGSGLGTFSLFFEQNRPARPQIGVFDDPHNLFLRLAVTGGLPFLLIFLSLLATSGYYAVKKLRTDKDLLTMASLAALVAWCVGVSFNPAPIPMFLLLAVILSGLLVEYTHAKSFPLVNRLKWAGYALGIVLIIFGVDLVFSEYLFGFAKQGYLNGDYQRSLKLSSLAEKVNPTNQLYGIYRIGGEIGLKIDPDVISNDIKKFTSIHSTQAGTYLEASNMYNLLYISTGNKIYLQSAIDEMNHSLSIDKYFADRYGQESLYYYQLGDLNASKSAVIKNLTLDDSNFAPWVLLAKIYQLENNRSATIQALSRAFKTRPDIPQLEYYLYLIKHQADIKKVPFQIAPQAAHLE